MTFDVSNEQSNYVAPGIQHKYQPTLVVIVSETCKKICKWCFRGRIFIDRKLESDAIANPDTVIKYARQHPEIKSVLLTGGDAFLADADYLKELVRELDKIEHIRSFRFGTRAIIYNPEIYGQMEEIFKLTNRPIYIPTHIVHPDEVTPQLMQITKKANAVFLSQTPLLKTVNYDKDILESLFYKLEEANIHSYYVFQCRAVDGNEKFVTTFKEGYEMLETVKGRLSGVTRRFRYAMSVDAGKLEVAGIENNTAYLRYHQAKNPDNLGKVITTDANAVWLANGKPMYLKENKFIF